MQLQDSMMTRGIAIALRFLYDGEATQKYRIAQRLRKTFPDKGDRADILDYLVEQRFANSTDYAGGKGRPATWYSITKKGRDWIEAYGFPAPDRLTRESAESRFPKRLDRRSDELRRSGSGLYLTRGATGRLDSNRIPGCIKDSRLRSSESSSNPGPPGV